MIQEFRNAIGAAYLGDQVTRFRLWSPWTDQVGVYLIGSNRVVAAEKTSRGYHEITVEDIAPGDLYCFQLDKSRERPDPASRSQPQGVHGPSEVVDPEFHWGGVSWRGLRLE